MNKELINKFIAMPMAITVLKQDQKSFESFTMVNIYLDKIDAVIDKLQEDFYTLKSELITKHHLDIRCIDKCKYNVGGKIIEYTPDELKKMTAKIMQEYLFKVVEFERKVRIWDESVVHRG